MCGRIGIPEFIFILVRLIDFTGDGFMLYLLITEWLRYSTRRITSNLVSLNQYCDSIEQLNFSEDDATTEFSSLSSRLLAYIIVVALSVFISPAILPLSLPRKSEEEELFDDNDDAISVDFQFRAKSQGKKRAVQYLLLVTLVVVHDIPLLALGTDLMTSLISTRGPRCYECVRDNLRAPNNRSDCITLSTFGWNNEFPFPMPTDYYWLIMLGTKLFGALGCIGFVLYLELQYKFQLHALKRQRHQELMRRHFVQNRRQRRKKKNYCGIWFASLLATFLLLIASVLVILAPTITILAQKTIHAQRLVHGDFGLIFFIGSIICWGTWGLFLILIVTNLCCFATRKKHCFATSEHDE